MQDYECKQDKTIDKHLHNKNFEQFWKVCSAKTNYDRVEYISDSVCIDGKYDDVSVSNKFMDQFKSAYCNSYVDGNSKLEFQSALNCA